MEKHHLSGRNSNTQLHHTYKYQDISILPLTLMVWVILMWCELQLLWPQTSCLISEPVFVCSPLTCNSTTLTSTHWYKRSNNIMKTQYDARILLGLDSDHVCKSDIMFMLHHPSSLGRWLQSAALSALFHHPFNSGRLLCESNTSVELS